MVSPKVVRCTESATLTSPIDTPLRSSIPKVLDNSIHFGYNPSMKQIKDLLQATVLALLFGGPVFFYILFQMKP